MDNRTAAYALTVAAISMLAGAILNIWVFRRMHKSMSAIDRKYTQAILLMRDCLYMCGASDYVIPGLPVNQAEADGGMIGDDEKRSAPE